MDKDMASISVGRELAPVARLKGTGLFLEVTDAEGNPVDSGVQLNITTMEIEAVPSFTVNIKGYRDMYEKLGKVSKWLGILIKADEAQLKTSRFESLNEAIRADIKNYKATKADIDSALAKAEEK